MLPLGPDGICLCRQKLPALTERKLNRVDTGRDLPQEQTWLRHEFKRSSLPCHQLPRGSQANIRAYAVCRARLLDRVLFFHAASRLASTAGYVRRTAAMKVNLLKEELAQLLSDFGKLVIATARLQCSGSNQEVCQNG